MKNTKRILALLLVIIFFITALPLNVSMAKLGDEQGDLSDEDLGVTAGSTDLDSEIYEIAGTGLRYLKIIGSIAALVVLAIYGILWFISGPREKAALKEKLGTYLLGALLLFMGAQIAVWVIDAVEQIYTSPVL